MSKIDRLSALLTRFELQVVPSSTEGSNLFVTCCTNSTEPKRLVVSRETRNPLLQQGEAIMFCAHVDWGSAANPLYLALPDTFELSVKGDRETMSLVVLLQAEADARRCGMVSVLNRIGEILVVRVMRLLIERGETQTGLFGGLSDPRLSRAIVAIHENPGRIWKNEDLAYEAGLSLSRFAELFHQTVGEAPMTYLRRWRLVLARQEFARGARIQDVSRRYGYGSGEALTRAFTKQYGESPSAVRRRNAA